MISSELDEALSIFGEYRDVVALRPASTAVPAWATRRGWDRYLSELTDAQLFEAERDPAKWVRDHEAAPRSLRELGRSVRALTKRYDRRDAEDSVHLERHVKRRKQVQIDALCEIAAARFSDVSRIVDLGSGSGHLTRALARTLRPGSVIGIERDPDRVARATELADVDGPRFLRADGTESTEIALHPDALRRDDLVVGLHPCGSLGDALVRRARAAGAHVLVVGCCFQKIDGPRRHASSERGRAHEFVVPQAQLGLANIAPVSFEGSGTLEAKRVWRRTRLALRLALESRGVHLRPGDEGRGLTKERVRHGLHAIAGPAFARHDLTPPTEAELRDASALAAESHGHIARFALVRHALARVLELGIALDRACLLEEGGWDTEVATLFSARTSPRNLAIVARAPS